MNNKNIKKICRGGFARVEYLEESPGNTIARKVFDPRPDILLASNQDKLKKRFKREVKIQSSLESQSFIPILDFDLDCNAPWFTMPLADRNFEDEINESKQDGKDLTEQLAEILFALEELHSLGYTHRDLKPQNILLHNKRWKLSDFGLVLPETSTFTSSRSAWGSAPYCAPEQVLDFKHSTQKVDIYAFGAILHDVYGDGPNARIPYQQHTCEGPIGTIIERCTVKEPEKRFQNVSILRGALLTILSSPSTHQSNPSTTEWLEKLNNIFDWDDETMLNFSRYISSEANEEDINVICVELDEKRIQDIFDADGDLWYKIALMYCEWAKGSFDFAYCDVIINRLEMIYNLGNIECKAAAAIATAELGSSHNRWNVMRNLLTMCSPRISENLAYRIGIEIIVEDVKQHFLKSAKGIGKSLKDFHPRIEKVLVD